MAKQIVIIDKSLCCFSVFVSFAMKHIMRSNEVSSYEAIIFNIRRVYLYYYVSHSERKSRFFCAVLYNLFWPVWYYHIFFLNYTLNDSIFRKNYIEHKMCVLIFCTTFV